MESKFQLCFSVNVWCPVLDDQLNGPLILEGHLTGEAYLRFELSVPSAMDQTWQSPKLASQVSRLKPTGLLCMGMDERTGFQCEGGNARCTARSHSRCSRPHQKQLVEATTRNLPSSLPSGRLFCGQQWHFRKPALSTYQFKLKVISRS